MSLRIQFENDMQDWIVALGRPTWNDEAEIYEEKEWQLAWIAYSRSKSVVVLWMGGKLKMKVI